MPLSAQQIWTLQKHVQGCIPYSVWPEQFVMSVARAYPGKISVQDLQKSYGALAAHNPVMSFVEFIHVHRAVNARLHSLGLEVRRGNGTPNSKYWLARIHPKPPAL